MIEQNPIELGRTLEGTIRRYMQASLPVSLKYPRLREQITTALGEKDRLVKGPFVEALSDFVKAASLKDLVSPQLAQRLKQALVGVSRIAGEEFQLLPYGDRLGISLPFGWVSEFQPYFAHNDADGVDYVECRIWPANTKAQGNSIFTGKSLDWAKKKTLKVGGKEYPLTIEYEVKLSHFNGYITSIEFSETDTIKPLHTIENYKMQSGKWERPSWSELERLLDEHFKPEFRWREQCGWAENFLDTDRSYLTMSLGFVVTVSIPFSLFKSLDKKETDIVQVSELLWKTVQAFKNLVD